MANNKRSIKSETLRRLLMDTEPHWVLKLNKIKNFSIFDPRNNNQYIGYLDLANEQIVYDGDYQA